MKKIIILASLLLTIQSSFVIGAAGVMISRSICELDNSEEECGRKYYLSGIGLTLTSSLFGTGLGLIVLADNGEYMINTNSEEAKQLCESDKESLNEEDAAILSILEQEGVCKK